MKYCATTLLVLCLLVSLIPASRAQQTANTTPRVFVLPINIQVPANAKKLGSIKLGNNSTTVHCQYDALVAQAKKKATAMGGNLVKIKELAGPTFVSKCYKIEAEVYYADPLPQYGVSPEADNGITTVLADTAKFALLYVYRLADSITFQPGYNLYMGDSVLCHVRNKSKEVLKIFQAGKLTLTAKTERKIAVTIDIAPGQVYFLRCGTIMGSLIQIPYMEQVPKNVGAAEYQSLVKTKKDVDISYLNQIH